MDEDEKQEFIRKSKIYEGIDEDWKKNWIKTYIDGMTLEEALYKKHEKNFHYCENCGAYSKEIVNICHKCGKRIGMKEEATKRFNEFKKKIFKLIKQIAEIDIDAGTEVLQKITQLLARNVRNNINGNLLVEIAGRDVIKDQEIGDVINLIDREKIDYDQFDFDQFDFDFLADRLNNMWQQVQNHEKEVRKRDETMKKQKTVYQCDCGEKFQSLDSFFEHWNTHQHSPSSYTKQKKLENDYWNQGIKFRKLGKYQEAIECFKKVLIINPKNYEAKAYMDLLYSILSKSGE